MLYLVWRYLIYHWIKTVLLTASITLILFLPSGLRVLIQQSRSQLAARAESTPLVVGARDWCSTLAISVPRSRR
ncbi:MAG: hypothetical protein ACYSUS_04610 [Planctomycetota bacterium]